MVNENELSLRFRYNQAARKWLYTAVLGKWNKVHFQPYLVNIDSMLSILGHQFPGIVREYLNQSHLIRVKRSNPNEV